jgi:metal-dependent amidase/aminoacylase/carboxypeptidase family protein
MKHIMILVLFLFHEGSALSESFFSKDLLSFYQDLHQNPELSLKEERTGAALAKALQKEGMTVSHPFAGTGVVGVFQNGKGKTVLLRSDLDALPIGEETSLPYASKKKAVQNSGKEVGVMHACGHDILLTVQFTDAFMIGDEIPSWWADLASAVSEALAPFSLKVWDTRHLREIQLPNYVREIPRCASG